MSSPFQANELTSQEREQAHEHWEALMFAPSRAALEKAQVELLQASATVRQAVTASIHDFWLRDHDPQKDENPFQSLSP